MPAVLLQVGRDSTVLAVAVLGVVGLVLVLAAIGLWDRFTRGERDTRELRLVETAEGEVSMVGGERPVGEPVRLGADEMRRVVEAIETQNEWRLHALQSPSGEELAYERWDREADAEPATLVIEASKGLVELDADGTVRATPPLDDAVHDDLVALVAHARRA
jgi:hypothetical protein